MVDISFNVIALAALFLAVWATVRPAPRPGRLFWTATVGAFAGPAVWCLWMLSGGWLTTLSAVLWVSIAGSAAMFILLASTSPQGWRIAPLLMPILSLAGAMASLISWVEVPGPPLAGGFGAWVALHVIVSVLTYSLLGLAAVASLSIFLQERALKRKRPTPLSRMLPSVADAERIAGRLLLDSEIVLGLGLITGLILQYVETGSLFSLQRAEKMAFSASSFVLIGLLLIGHRVCGVRGRVAARIVLVSYLLLTLAYPGVKFVQQVLISPPAG